MCQPALEMHSLCAARLPDSPPAAEAAAVAATVVATAAQHNHKGSGGTGLRENMERTAGKPGSVQGLLTFTQGWLPSLLMYMVGQHKAVHQPWAVSCMLVQVRTAVQYKLVAAKEPGAGIHSWAPLTNLHRMLFMNRHSLPWKGSSRQQYLEVVVIAVVR